MGLLSITVSAKGLDVLIQKLRDFTNQADQVIDEALLSSVNKNVVVVAKVPAPKRTGALVASISVIPGGEPMQVILQAEKYYAPFLEYGTHPHIITANSAKALRFQKGNQIIFATSVHHPGIPEGKFSFMRPAIAEGIEQVIEDLALAIVAELEV